MLIEVHPENPTPRNIQKIVDCLKRGGVIIYPTDTVYAFGCDIHSKNAVEKICALRGIKPEKANFSFICSDLSQLSEYAKQVNTPVFRIMKNAFPGPYTFILKASGMVPKVFKNKKKTIGIRVPENKIAQAIVEALGNPLMSASIKDDDEFAEYITDPTLMDERFGNRVDLVVDGGFGKNEPSTVIDCSEGEPEVIREGIGSLDIF